MNYPSTPNSSTAFSNWLLGSFCPFNSSSIVSFAIDNSIGFGNGFGAGRILQ